MNAYTLHRLKILEQSLDAIRREIKEIRGSESFEGRVIRACESHFGLSDLRSKSRDAISVKARACAVELMRGKGLGIVYISEKLNRDPSTLQRLIRLNPPDEVDIRAIKELM